MAISASSSEWNKYVLLQLPHNQGYFHRMSYQKLKIIFRTLAIVLPNHREKSIRILKETIKLNRRAWEIYFHENTPEIPDDVLWD